MAAAKCRSAHSAREAGTGSGHGFESEGFARHPRGRVARLEALLLSPQESPQFRLFDPEQRTRPIPVERVDEERCVPRDGIGLPDPAFEPGRVVDREQDPAEEGAEILGTPIPDL